MPTTVTFEAGDLVRFRDRNVPGVFEVVDTLPNDLLLAAPSDDGRRARREAYVLRADDFVPVD